MEIFIRRIANPLSVYGDADSNEPDGSDWNYCFVVEEVPRDAFEAEHGKEEVADWEQGTGGDGGWSRKIPSALLSTITSRKQKVTIYLHADGSVSEEASTDPMFPDLDKREVATEARCPLGKARATRYSTRPTFRERTSLSFRSMATK